MHRFIIYGGRLSMLYLAVSPTLAALVSDQSNFTTSNTASLSLTPMWTTRNSPSVVNDFCELCSHTLSCPRSFKTFFKTTSPFSPSSEGLRHRISHKPFPPRPETAFDCHSHNHIQPRSIFYQVIRQTDLCNAYTSNFTTLNRWK